MLEFYIRILPNCQVLPNHADYKFGCCVNMNSLVHTYTHIDTYTHIQTHIHTLTYTHSHTHMHIHTYTNKDTHIYTHASIKTTDFKDYIMLCS